MPRLVSPDVLLDEAVRAAAKADVVIAVLGTNPRVESEGQDRTTLALPGGQRTLVDAVAAVNSRTVVVLNAGAPVEVPSSEVAPAVLLTHFGGQRGGDAIAAMLFGVAEPGGRLTTTWPHRHDEAPVLSTEPTDGVLRYSEGTDIGYRAWESSGVAPRFSFGHGLGYTSWSIRTPRFDDTRQVIRAAVTNTGLRRGKQVVQVYGRPVARGGRHAPRVLVGWAAVRADPGESVDVEIVVLLEALARWDGRWVQEEGRYAFDIGFSWTDVRERVTAQLFGLESTDPA